MTAFEVMTEKQGIDPCPETIVSMLQICFQCRQPSKGLELIEKVRAQSNGRPLDGSIYDAAISGCGSSGLISQGIALVEDAAKHGASLPSGALTVLAQALQHQGQTGAVELERLRELAEQLNINLLPAELAVAASD